MPPARKVSLLGDSSWGWGRLGVCDGWWLVGFGWFVGGLENDGWVIVLWYFDGVVVGRVGVFFGWV